MIDADGFRANVGIVICNRMGQVFWARRYGQHSWQFPQGGIDEGETAEQAMFSRIVRGSRTAIERRGSFWRQLAIG